jgi:hypothetical protein
MDYVANLPPLRIRDGKDNAANIPYLIPTDNLAMYNID